MRKRYIIMSDNEIIKAFKMHLLDNRDCELCPYGPAYYRCDIILLKDVLNLINRLQAQNKDLSETAHNLTLEKDALFDKAEELKVKNERLREQYFNALYFD